jgi:hypothetical protein
MSRDAVRPSRLAEPVLGLAKGKTRGLAPQDEDLWCPTSLILRCFAKQSLEGRTSRANPPFL